MKYRFPCQAFPRLSLDNDEIHIWMVFLDQIGEEITDFAHFLSSEEISRAERFYFEIDRFRFIARRGILRNILNCYIDVDPVKMEFSYCRYGKPLLSEKYNHKDIRFSSSHSNGVVLFAFARSRKIGIDIEFIHPILDMELIVNNIFSDNEKIDFQALPESEKNQAFFNCWTRKEAFVKATGRGLSQPLDSFDVTLIPGEPARLIRAGDEPQAASHWTLKDLKPAAGFAVALAFKGPIRRLQYVMWPYAVADNATLNFSNLMSGEPDFEMVKFQSESA